MMETTQETIVQDLPGFGSDLFAEVQKSEPSALLAAKRQEAFATYETIAAPTHQDEEWRRTDPALFPLQDVTLSPLLEQVETVPAGEWDAEFDVVVAVTDDHFAIVQQTSAALDAGVTVCSLRQAAEAHPEWIQKYLQGEAMPAQSGKFEAFNDAFWNFGLFVHIPDGVEWERGMLIRYDMKRNASMLVPRLVVVAGQQSRATIVEHLHSDDDICFVAVPERELYVDEAADFKLVSLQEWGNNSFQITNDWGLVQRDAKLNWITLNFGTARSKMKFGSDVAGPGSAADMDGLFFATGDQHMDQRTLQIHSSPDTYSRLLYKGAVKDVGRSVYQGLIIARPGAIRVDAYQTNNNLVLNDGARADSIPGLLIDADDLKCSHGSTIGNLDPDQLFYLRSRGLAEAEARRFLIMGFFEEVIDRIPHGFIKDVVHRTIEKKMGS
jgi:Fe-S cluster assembly protein SufD